MPWFLARHGQTDWNREQRLQSRSDIPLNETGRAQARALGRALRARELRFAAVCTSPLARARETVRIALAGTALAWCEEPALLELDLGAYEGRLEAELAALPDGRFAAWKAARFGIAAPGGETVFDGVARVRGLIATLREVPGDVLLVAHQGINVALKVALSGASDAAALERYRQANDEVDVWDPAAGVALERFGVGR